MYGMDIFIFVKRVFFRGRKYILIFINSIIAIYLTLPFIVYTLLMFSFGVQVMKEIRKYEQMHNIHKRF